MGSGNSSEQFPKKIQFDLPNRVDVSFSESLEARIVEYTTSNWEFMFGLLERFVAREGTASIAQNHVEDGFNLGFWASNRRAEYRRGQLPLPQAERLDGLRGWSWHLRDSAWEEGFLRLEAFANREKHCLVPASHIENGFKLGNWVTSQRSSHPKGRLPSDRVERLESLPGWSWDALDAKWDEAFSILARFADRESHSRVPGSHSEEHFQLGTWVTSQRTKRSRLLPDQVERLESLPGWSWDPQAEKWEEGFSRLGAFAKREGNVRVPVNYPDEEYGLRRWMQKQRSRHALGRLPSDRVERLESLPGWSWDALAAKWDEGFSCLVEYADREGDCFVPTSHVESGFKLGAWVNVQRTRYGKRQLDEARVELLEALPGWAWDARDALWDQMYAELLVLIGDGGFEGFSRSRTGESEKVGRWLTKQRSNFRAGKLSRDRIAQLESIPNWTWEPIDSKWEEGFSRLSVFLEREGSAKVPEDYSEAGYNLGTWVRHQKAKYRQGRMSTEQARRFEELPGWVWDAIDSRWDQMYAELLVLIGDGGFEGFSRSRTGESEKVGRWLTKQRSNFRAGKLSRDRIAQLESIPNWTWVPFDSKWEKGFSRLCEFLEREGTANVPSKYSESGYNLGFWVKHQRSKFRQGRMSTEQARRFEELPGWVWNSR